MKIKDIHIDRFGVWRDLMLPLSDKGVTVFYGPNEAGKSTVMRFVRGALYGFDSQGRRITRHGLSTAGRGTLRIAHGGHEHHVTREADAGERGRVRVDQLDWGNLSEDRVTTFLGGTSESMFQNIFAIGLQELQELATLDGEEVARHIYGLSLGPDGERILRASDALQRERSLLVSDDHKGGEAVELARRVAEIDRELAEVGDLSDKHRQLQSERGRLLAEIDQAEAARRDLQDNLRGYRFLQRVHAPWSRERNLRQEQAALPNLDSCPADTLDRYDALTRDIDEKKRRRLKLRQDAKRLAREAGEKSGDPTLLQHECTIRRLAEERQSIRDRERRLAENQSRADKLRRQWETKVGNRENLLNTANSSKLASQVSGLGRLLKAARSYQQAQTNRKRTVSRYEKFVAASQKRQAGFNERLKSLDGISPEAGIKTLEEQLTKIDTLNRLCLEEAQLTGQRLVPNRSSRSSEPARQPRKLINYRDLPPMFYLVMWFFTMAGLTLFVLGLWGAATERVAAGNLAWIVGGIYACFGLCMAGVTWTVRQHIEQFFEGGLTGDATFAFTGKVDPTRHDDCDAAEVDIELSRVRTSIADLVRRSGLPGLRQAHADRGPLIDADLIRRIARRQADLEQLQREQERIQSDRQRLSRYRDLLRRRQRDVGQKRRQWCDALRECGLEETLKVDQALQQWQDIIETEDLRRSHAALQKEIDSDRAAIDDHFSELARLQKLLKSAPPPTSSETSDSDRLIAGWLDVLNRSGSASDEQVRLRRESRNKRKEASRLEASVRDLSSQRRQLLLQAGASTREELRQRLQSHSRHQELARLIEEAQFEVQLAAEEEPELALVEEDLLAFDPGETKRRITDIEIELKQLDRDLQTTREEMGRVKRELAELADDRSTLSLRFEREQVAGELREVIERWAAIELSIDSVDRIRHRMERHGQSETLQLASKYLSQLTVGRYHNIWSPLGERHLRIDDDTNQTLRTEQLSTGTREQLFLAIRLAMIRRLAQEGIELPLVLDDVFVNFDQTRTEAAVETILDVAAAGQQVLLFTCHLHLADIFESKGIDALWLPSNQETPQRRAG